MRCTLYLSILSLLYCTITAYSQQRSISDNSLPHDLDWVYQNEKIYESLSIHRHFDHEEKTEHKSTENQIIDSVFIDVASIYNLADIRKACGAMWLDFDNDDDLDLLVASSYTPEMSRLYQNTGEQFIDIAPQVGFGSGHPTALVHICGGDYDNDGDLDLLTYIGGYGLRENRYNESGQFVDVGGFYTWGVFVD